MSGLPCQTYIARSANQCTVIPSSKHEGTRTFRFRTYSHLGKMSGSWTRMRGRFKKALGTGITGPRNVACSEESQSEPLSATYSEEMRMRVCSPFTWPAPELRKKKCWTSPRKREHGLHPTGGVALPAALSECPMLRQKRAYAYLALRSVITYRRGAEGGVAQRRTSVLKTFREGLCDGRLSLRLFLFVFLPESILAKPTL